MSAVVPLAQPAQFPARGRCHPSGSFLPTPSHGAETPTRGTASGDRAEEEVSPKGVTTGHVWKVSGEAASGHK